MEALFVRQVREGLCVCELDPRQALVCCQPVRATRALIRPHGKYAHAGSCGSASRDNVCVYVCVCADTPAGDKPEVCAEVCRARDGGALNGGCLCHGEGLQGVGQVLLALCRILGDRFALEACLHAERLHQ